MKLLESMKSRHHTAGWLDGYIIRGTPTLAVIFSSLMLFLLSDQVWAGDHVYYKSILRADILEECQHTASRECSYAFFALVHDPQKRSLLGAGSYNSLHALPPSLYNFAVSLGASSGDKFACDLERLSDEVIALRHEASLLQGEKMYVALMSQDGVNCFTRVSPHANEIANIFLIFDQGDILGWLECRYREGIVKSCLVRLAPQTRDCDERFSPVEISIASALEPKTALSSIRELVDAIYTEVSQNYNVCFPVDRYRGEFTSSADAGMLIFHTTEN